MSMASRTAYSTWTPQKPTLFDGHYIRNRSTLDIGVLGYIGIVQHKEHSREVLSIPPGTPCTWFCIIRYCHVLGLASGSFLGKGLPSFRLLENMFPVESDTSTTDIPCCIFKVRPSIFTETFGWSIFFFLYYSSR